MPGKIDLYPEVDSSISKSGMLNSILSQVMVAALAASGLHGVTARGKRPGNYALSGRAVLWQRRLSFQPAPSFW